MHAIFRFAAGIAALAAVSTPAFAEPTIWGIYGKHDVHDCPLNNRETAKFVVEVSKRDLSPLMEKYGVTNVRDQYHSGLEHTFVWVVDTKRPHDLQGFARELCVAAWNDLTIVPVRRFAEDVIPEVKRLHGLKWFLDRQAAVTYSNPVSAPFCGHCRRRRRSAANGTGP